MPWATKGAGAFADTNSDVYVDMLPGAVTLYVPDIARGQRMVDAAKNAQTKIDTGRIKLFVANSPAGRSTPRSTSSCGAPGAIP